MLNGLRNFFSAPVIEGDPEKAQDIRTTYRVALALLILAPLSIIFILQLEPPTRYYTLGGTLAGIFVWLFTIYMIGRGWIRPAKITILVVNTVNLLLVIYFIGNLERPTIFTTLFLVALAVLLFPKRGALIYGAILLFLSTALFILGQTSQVPAPTFPLTDTTIFSIYFFTLIAVSILLEIISANMRSNLENSAQIQRQLQQRNLELDKLSGQLEQRVEERTSQLEKRASQLEAISSVARTIASIQNLNELLPTITRLVSERFGYYHTGIFLVEENREFAILQATNSQGGQKMLDRQHKLKLDANSIVGFVTHRGEPRIALDVGVDSVYFNNPDLPDTRSEMALPLRIGTRVIGALDVQSTQPNAFTQEDIAVLATLADQVAIAIENARLFSESQKALFESQTTFDKYVKQEWISYARQIKQAGFVYNGKQVLPLDENTQRDKIKTIAQTGRLSLEKASSAIAIPIKLRGQTIGMLDVRSRKGQREWTQDEITLLESAAERAALALENARLVESAQRRASRERTIGEISSKIGSVSDLESIMQTAVEELGRRIGGAAEVTIELGKDDKQVDS